MELQLVVYSPPPSRIGSLPKLPQFDQNFLDTGLGFASQRIFLRKTNNVFWSKRSQTKGRLCPSQNTAEYWYSRCLSCAACMLLRCYITYVARQQRDDRLSTTDLFQKGKIEQALKRFLCWFVEHFIEECNVTRWPLCRFLCWKLSLGVHPRRHAQRGLAAFPQNIVIYVIFVITSNQKYPIFKVKLNFKEVVNNKCHQTRILLCKPHFPRTMDGPTEPHFWNSGSGWPRHRENREFGC